MCYISLSSHTWALRFTWVKLHSRSSRYLIVGFNVQCVSISIFGQMAKCENASLYGAVLYWHSSPQVTQDVLDPFSKGLWIFWAHETYLVAYDELDEVSVFCWWTQTGCHGNKNPDHVILSLQLLMTWRYCLATSCLSVTSLIVLIDCSLGLWSFEVQLGTSLTVLWLCFRKCHVFWSDILWNMFSKILVCFLRCHFVKWLFWFVDCFAKCCVFLSYCGWSNAVTFFDFFPGVTLCFLTYFRFWYVVVFSLIFSRLAL